MEGTKVLRLKWKALLLSVLIFGGCATFASIRPGQGTVFEVTGQNYDDVWENAVRVVSWNFKIIESEKTFRFAVKMNGFMSDLDPVGPNVRMGIPFFKYGQTITADSVFHYHIESEIIEKL